MHRYNNQDHSMFTAMLTVENIATGADHDVWAVNVEEEYHEESSGGGSRRGTGRDAPVVPSRIIAAPITVPEGSDDRAPVAAPPSHA